jgi:hypothetical protein
MVTPKRNVLLRLGRTTAENQEAAVLSVTAKLSEQASPFAAGRFGDGRQST